MNKILLLLSFFLCFQGDIQEYSWNENYKLKWSDFKAEPEQNSHAVAVTASGITFSYSIQKSNIRGITGFKTKTFAHFYPEHSWCKKELVDDNILKHEQYHFNITELNVRYLREVLSKLAVSKTIIKDLEIAHKNAESVLEKMQNTYDAESDYSMNVEGQQKWIAFVNEELKRLEKFKSK